MKLQETEALMADNIGHVCLFLIFPLGHCYDNDAVSYARDPPRLGRV